MFFPGYKFLKLIKIVILIPAIAVRSAFTLNYITIGLCSFLFIVTLLDLYAMNKMETITDTSIILRI